MLSNRLFAAFAVAAVATLFAFPAAAQDTVSDQQKAATEAYLKFGSVNENHAFLKSLVGDWNVQTTAWMQPGAAPITSQGTGTAEPVLGGRFIMMKFDGTMFGQPYEGIEILGYDNLKKQYTTFWIDNTSTAFYYMSGTRDESGKALNESGLWPDPMSGGEVKVRDVTRVVGPDEIVYELYITGSDGKEFKALENRMLRKK
jgi:hypothetical protein